MFNQNFIWVYISYDALVNKFDILERVFKLDWVSRYHVTSSIYKIFPICVKSKPYDRVTIWKEFRLAFLVWTVWRIMVRIFVSVTLLNMIGQSKEPELHAHQKSFTIPAKQVICIQLGFCRKAEEMMKDSLKL